MAQYGKPEYWEDRYNKDKEPFDWYQRWSGIKDVVTQFIQPNHQILNVGAGSSRKFSTLNSSVGLTEEMFQDGFENITSIDISTTVVKQMQEVYREKYPSLIYKQMDVRQMSAFEDKSFDVVIDKGTFDSILCGDGSGPNAEQMLSEISRVLTDDGVYICISYGLKESRVPFFHKPAYGWLTFNHCVAKPTISTSAVVQANDKDEKNFHWIYANKKQGGESQ